MPAARAEALRQVYRAEHDWLSQILPGWTNVEKLTETKLESLAQMAFSQCTLCHRCTLNCPMGLDTPLVMSTVRAMATAAGQAPEMLEMLTDAAIEKGRDPSSYLAFFMDGICEMEQELQQLTGHPFARIPMCKEGAKMLYVALAGAHTILPAAAIFDAVDENWI